MERKANLGFACSSENNELVGFLHLHPAVKKILEG